MTSVERTHRWRVAFLFVLFTSTAGLYLESPLVFLASLLGVAYTGYPLLMGPPSVDLELSRTVSDETPSHGDLVTVTVSITNTGPRTLADLRIIDGVPTLLSVTDGTPRHTATLRPGTSTTFQYTIAAKHGSHRFTPTTVIAHDISGSTRVETELTTGEQTTVREKLDSTVDLRKFQLRQQARQYAGQNPAESGESGLEFQQIRAYQHGDPISQIDWRRYARTNELTTIEFREEHRTAVVLCLDARQEVMRAAASTEPHAVAYCVAAAQQVLSTLERRSERVGVAVFATEFDWREPSTGREQYARIEHLLDTREDDQPISVGDDFTGPSTEQVQELIARIQGNVEVVLFSPLTDEFGETAAQQLDAYGHAVTVVSPDVISGGSVSEEFVRIERVNRVQRLRKRAIPVADWPPESPLVWPVNHTRKETG